MAIFGLSFVGLIFVPVNFPYWVFAVLIGANGIGGGMFAAPNSASIMSSVPARQRGVASGMRSTCQNSGTALSIGVFFSLMIVGLAASQHVLTGNRFFPALISGPFHSGLLVVFAVAIGLAAVAGVASLLRGGRYVHPEATAATEPADSVASAA